MKLLIIIIAISAPIVQYLCSSIQLTRSGRSLLVFVDEQHQCSSYNDDSNSHNCTCHRNCYCHSSPWGRKIYIRNIFGHCNLLLFSKMLYLCLYQLRKCKYNYKKDLYNIDTLSQTVTGTAIAIIH